MESNSFHMGRVLQNGRRAEAISAAFAADAGDVAAVHEFLDDDLEVFLGDLLPLRHIFERDRFDAVPVFGQVQKDPQSITPFRRNHAFTACFQSFTYYTAG